MVDDLLGRIEERLEQLTKRVGQMPDECADRLAVAVALAKQEIFREIESERAQNKIVRLIVFGACAIILMGFFGAVSAYFQGRQPGSPVNVQTQGSPFR